MVLLYKTKVHTLTKIYIWIFIDIVDEFQPSKACIEAKNVKLLSEFFFKYFSQEKNICRKFKNLLQKSKTTNCRV